MRNIRWLRRIGDGREEIDHEEVRQGRRGCSGLDAIAVQGCVGEEEEGMGFSHGKEGRLMIGLVFWD